MRRPLTPSFSATALALTPQAQPGQPAVPPWRELATIVSALVTTLQASEIGPKAGSVMRVQRSAMRRQGETALALGGFKVMDAVLHQVAEVDPARAVRRQAFIREAWTGLPGWRP